MPLCPGMFPPSGAPLSPDGFSGGVEPSVAPLSPAGFSGGVVPVAEASAVCAEAVVVEESDACAAVERVVA